MSYPLSRSGSGTNMGSSMSANVNSHSHSHSHVHPTSSSGGYTNNNNASGSSGNVIANDKLVTRQKLALLLAGITSDGDVSLDESVEEILQDMVVDYVKSATRTACLLAKHRRSELVESADFKTAIKRQPHP